jgi:hypothetical protein
VPDRQVCPCGRGYVSADDAYNSDAVKAVQFALTLGLEADTFLKSWIEGDLSEWSEYEDFKS